MERKDYVLAVIAASEGASFTPVQLQKLFFLLDRKAASLINGPHFNFEAFHYGPFDKAVYDELRHLERDEYAEIEVGSNNAMRKYRPSDLGLHRGRELLGEFPHEVREYIRNLSAWVRRQTFASLVSSVYNMYPEMKVNSVFRY